MISRIALDTNAYSALAKGDSDVLEALAEAERTYLPVTVIGELCAGFRGGTQEKRNRAQLRRFFKKPSVRILHTTEEVADYYGQIFDFLSRKKTPIPANDIWIAAHAMEQGVALVTYDKHFQHIEGLRLWK